MRVPKGTPLVSIPGGGGSGNRRFGLGLNRPMMQANATAEMFNNSMDWRPIGEGAANVAKATGMIAEDLLKKDAETRANNAYAALADEANNHLYGEGGIFSRKGVNAVNAVADTKAFYDKATQRLGKGMNDATATLFNQMAERSRMSVQHSVAGYAGQQINEARLDSLKAGITADQQTALLGFGDDRVFGASLQAVTEKADNLAAAAGMEPEARDQLVKKTVSETVLGRAERLIANGQLVKAAEIGDSDVLLPTHQDAVKQKLKAEYRRIEAEHKAALEEREKANEKALWESALGLYGTLPPAIAAEEALNDPALAQNPEMRRKVVNYFDWIDGQMNQAVKRRENAKLEQSYDGIVEAAQKNDIDTINGIITSSSPEHRPKLEDHAHRVVYGDDRISDPDAYSEALLRVENEEHFDVMAEYGGKLNSKEIRELKNSQVRTYLAREKLLFNEEAENWLGTAEGKRLKADSGLSVNKLYMKFKASIPDGGFKDIATRNKAFQSFWRREVLSKRGMVFGTSNVEAIGFRAAEFAAQGYYPMKGEGYARLKKEVEDQIFARDGVRREATEEEIQRLYQSRLGITPTTPQDWSLPSRSGSGARAESSSVWDAYYQSPGL